MFAVFKSGGKQHRVSAGQTVKVEKLEGEAGTKITLDEVLSANGKIDGLDKASVEAEILETAKDKKVIVFKKKRRQNYRRKNGHRQMFTKLRILSITDAEGKVTKAEAKKPAEKKAEAPKAEAKAAAPKAEAKKAAPKTEAKKPAAKTAEKTSDKPAAKKAAPKKAAAKKEEK